MAAIYEIARRQKTGDVGTVKEATFRHQQLTVKTAEHLLVKLQSLRALDLSHNSLNDVPLALPKSLIALDLSFNCFTTVPPSHRFGSLMELKMTNCQIESTVGLFVAISLEHLDLSNNFIHILEGLESLRKLKTLKLDNNEIASDSALRPLSANSQLVELSLVGNPISRLPTYKTMVLGYVIDLRHLDGKPISRKGRSSTQGKHGGYSGHFKDKMEMQLAQKASKSSGEISFVTSRISESETTAPHVLQSKPPPTAQTSRMKEVSLVSLGNDSLLLDASGDFHRKIDFYDQSNPLTVIEKNPLPWRNPPNPMPRPWKGKQLFNPLPVARAAPLQIDLALAENELSYGQPSSSIRDINESLSSSQTQRPFNRSIRPRTEWRCANRIYEDDSRPDEVGNSLILTHGSIDSVQSTPRQSTKSVIIKKNRNHSSNGTRPNNGDHSGYEQLYLGVQSENSSRSHHKSGNDKLSAAKSSTNSSNQKSSLQSNSPQYIRSGKDRKFAVTKTKMQAYRSQQNSRDLFSDQRDDDEPPLSQTLENRSAVLRARWIHQQKREIERAELEERKRQSTPVVESVDWHRLHYGGAGRSPHALSSGGASPKRRSRSLSPHRAFDDDVITEGDSSTQPVLDPRMVNPNALSHKYVYDGVTQTSSRSRVQPSSRTSRSRSDSEGELSVGSGTASKSTESAVSPYGRLRRLQNHLGKVTQEHADEAGIHNHLDDLRMLANGATDGNINEDDDSTAGYTYSRSQPTHDYDTSSLKSRRPQSNDGQLRLSSAAMDALTKLEKSGRYGDFDKLLGLVGEPAADDDGSSIMGATFNPRAWGLRLGLNTPVDSMDDRTNSDKLVSHGGTDSNAASSESDQLKMVMVKLMHRRQESLRQLKAVKNVHT